VSRVPPSPDNPSRLVEAGLFQCRYIIGPASAEALCCGAPTVGGSWCATHRRMIYDSRATARANRRR
jgi:hypothetical protein